MKPTRFSARCLALLAAGMAVGVFTGAGPSKGGVDWQYFADHATCTLEPLGVDRKHGGIASLRVVIRYRGDRTMMIPWDGNFGRVLWDGAFVLESDAGRDMKSSKDLKFITGDLYPSRERVILTKGGRLESVLDFSVLPATYLRGLLPPPGREAAITLFCPVPGGRKGLAATSLK